MTTASDIITLALKDIQVLDETETPSAALMADALSTLNQMLAMWQTDTINVYAQTESTYAPIGSETCTVGTGGNFNVVAPVKIDYLFLRIGNIDYPIELLHTIEEYMGITYKPIVGIPAMAFYNATNPTSILYLHPRPNTGILHLGYSVTLPVYSLAADAINLPDNYLIALRYSLAELLSSMMGVSLRPDITRIAEKARRILQRGNFAMPELCTNNNYESGVTQILRGY